MLKSHDSFHVVAHLEQGRGGTEDVDHSDVPFQDDLILAEFLQTGGLRSIDLKSSTTPAGLANWSGTHGLQIRRQAGNYFRIRFSVLGDSRGRGFLKASTVSFGIVPGIVNILPWSFSGAGERPRESFPSVASADQLVELPQIYMELQDQSGLALTHAACDGCVSITNEAMSGHTCELFGIRSPDTACADPKWVEETNSFCERLPLQPNLVPMGERTLKECQDHCSSDPECVAFNFLDPSSKIFDQGLSITSTCHKVRVRCQKASSSKGESIFFKPVFTDLSEECRCPSEVFDGRVVHHTLYSSQVAAGSRHVAAR